MTGSRFPTPGYSISGGSIDLTRCTRPLTNPNTGEEARHPDDPAGLREELRADRRAGRKFYSAGPPGLLLAGRSTPTSTTSSLPLGRDRFNPDDYFGQQLKPDCTAFASCPSAGPSGSTVERRHRLPEHPDERLPALGSEIGWYGDDLFPRSDGFFSRASHPREHITQNYFGSFDIWGLGAGYDVLGARAGHRADGPAGPAKAGFPGAGRPTVAVGTRHGSTSAATSASSPRTTTTPLRARAPVGKRAPTCNCSRNPCGRL